MSTETSVALVPAPQTVSLGTLQASSGQDVISGATAMATALAKVIESRKLYATIQGKRHVQVEGWTTLATMMGCLPREVSIEAEDDGSYVATVELVRISDGTVLSRASALCGDDTDRPWNGRPKYARRSMAATRATSKACRLAFSWVMVLAGYQPTPAEEMPREEPEERPPAQPRGRGPSEKQLKRLFAISKEHGWSSEAVKAVMAERWGIDSTSELTRGQYDTLCDEVLPAGPPREGEVIPSQDELDATEPF